jgi:hypothetical protein
MVTHAIAFSENPWRKDHVIRGRVGKLRQENRPFCPVDPECLPSKDKRPHEQTQDAYHYQGAKPGGHGPQIARTACRAPGPHKRDPAEAEAGSPRPAPTVTPEYASSDQAADRGRYPHVDFRQAREALHAERR